MTFRKQSGGQRTLVFYRANKRARGAQRASFRPKIGPERKSGDNFTPEARTGEEEEEQQEQEHGKLQPEGPAVRRHSSHALAASPRPLARTTRTRIEIDSRFWGKPIGSSQPPNLRYIYIYTWILQFLCGPAASRSQGQSCLGSV